MPIEVYWLNDEHTLIRWDFVGVWSSNELHSIIQRTNDMINTQDHIINHVIDFTQSTHVPPKVLAEMRYAVSKIPKNVGRVIIITNGGFLEMLGQTAQRFSWFSNKITMVRTSQEAYEYLAEA